MNNRMAFLFPLFLYAQLSCAQPYSCETSRIGKLVVKPLMQGGKINYKKAITSAKDKRAATGKDITTLIENPGNDGNTYIARHLTIDEGRTIDLLFVSSRSGKCTYQITSLSKEGISGIRLNEDGEVIDWEENSPLSDELKAEQQKLADEWLRYFD
jgi:hypothetical protein